MSRCRHSDLRGSIPVHTPSALRAAAMQDDVHIENLHVHWFNCRRPSCQVACP